jgi:MFS family permease
VRCVLQSVYMPSYPVIILYVGSFSEGLLDGFMAVVIPLYVVSQVVFSLPEPIIVGILLSLSGLVDSLLLPFAGMVSDRLRKRKVFIQFGRALIILTLFLFTGWSSFYILAILRIIMGIGNALLLPTSLALISESMPLGVQSTSMSQQTVFRVLGGIIGPVFGSTAQIVGFTLSFVCIGIFWLVVSILIAKSVHDSPAHPGILPANPINSLKPSPSNQNFSLREMIPLGFAMFTVAYAAMMIATLQTTLNIRLNQTAIVFGLAFGAANLARLVLQIPLGVILDRSRQKPFLLVGLALMAGATWGVGQADNTLMLVFYRVLQGVGMTFSMVPILGMTARYSSLLQRGRNMGISTSGFGLGMSLGTLVTGFLISYLSVDAAFAFSSIICLIAMVMVAIMVFEQPMKTSMRKKFY